MRFGALCQTDIQMRLREREIGLCIKQTVFAVWPFICPVDEVVGNTEKQKERWRKTLIALHKALAVCLFVYGLFVV